MEKDKKVALIISLTPVYIILIVEFLRGVYWTESIFFGIKILFLALMIIPALIAIIASFIPTMRKSKLLATLANLILFYYAFMIMLVSVNRDIIPQTTRFDMSMSGVGLALFALGIVLLMQQKQDPLFEELNRNILDVSDNTKALNNKVAKLEKTVRKIQPTKSEEK